MENLPVLAAKLVDARQYRRYFRDTADDGPEVSVLRTRPERYYARVVIASNNLQIAERDRIFAVEREFCKKVGL
jgi:hypothetical protein